MIIYIACAKIMTGSLPAGISLTTAPHFQDEANRIALLMAGCDVVELKNRLHVNTAIARENWERFQSFFDETKKAIPAAFAYDGMVFKKLAPETFSADELPYLNEHLLIASFLYGLLRPLDLIKPYRLEGNVMLSELGGLNLFEHWKPLLTDYFIERIKADDGILVNLASEEMKSLLDWNRVKKEVEIITPDFHVMKDGKLKTIVIYTKMCRGAMTRFILKNRITSPEELKLFEYEGFTLDESKEEFQFVLK